MWNQDVIKFTRQKSFIYGGVIKSNCKTGTKLYLSKLKIFKKIISFAFLHHVLWNLKTLDIISVIIFDIDRVVEMRYVESSDFHFIDSFEIHQIQNARYILHKKFYRTSS